MLLCDLFLDSHQKGQEVIIRQSLYITVQKKQTKHLKTLMETKRRYLDHLCGHFSGSVAISKKIVIIVFLLFHSFRIR